LVRRRGRGRRSLAVVVFLVLVVVLLLHAGAGAVLVAHRVRVGRRLVGAPEHGRRRAGLSVHGPGEEFQGFDEAVVSFPNRLQNRES
jgi:hypothetical protein